MRAFWTLIFAVYVGLFSACADTGLPALGAPVAVGTPAHGDVAGPRFSSGPDGQLVLSWMERGESDTTLRFSSLVQGGFSAALDVVTESGMFVNWADLPSVMLLRDEHLIAHWLRYSAAQTYSYDVIVAQSFDRGETWTEGTTAHTDGTPTEHGFVSMYPGAEGVALLRLDGRHTPNGSMTLRTAEITPAGDRVHEQEIDASVCDCCQTDVAITAGGPVAAYRDRSSDEVRDIYIARHVDGRWQPGKPLHADNWVIPGCPVNGPSIVANGEDVAVAWFTAANDKPLVRISMSRDAGITFTEPVDIASGKISGYVRLVSLGTNAFAASWVARDDDGKNVLRVRTLSASGNLGPVLPVATIDQLRVFPQLAYQDNQLVAVWTDETDEQRQLFAVRIPVTLP